MYVSKQDPPFSWTLSYFRPSPSINQTATQPLNRNCHCLQTCPQNLIEARGSYLKYWTETSGLPSWKLSGIQIHVCKWSFTETQPHRLTYCPRLFLYSVVEFRSFDRDLMACKALTIYFGALKKKISQPLTSHPGHTGPTWSPHSSQALCTPRLLLFLPSCCCFSSLEERPFCNLIHVAFPSYPLKILVKAYWRSYSWHITNPSPNRVAGYSPLPQNCTHGHWPFSVSIPVIPVSFFMGWIHG